MQEKERDFKNKKAPLILIILRFYTLNKYLNIIYGVFRRFVVSNKFHKMLLIMSIIIFANFRSLVCSYFFLILKNLLIGTFLLLFSKQLSGTSLVERQPYDLVCKVTRCEMLLSSFIILYKKNLILHVM